MAAYYNENDPFAAEWLRNLITRGLIAAGDVDERSIEDVSPSDLRSYTQCHFFAGIGGWSYALRLAGWPDDRPVWTGSCPCQPFSSAGARKGTDDPRHLWPHWRWLIDQCRPPIIFGEQVASKDGRLWLTGVRSDLEALGYAVGAADLCAAGVGAPHIRQRLYWLADSDSRERERLAASEGCLDDREASGRQQGDSESQHGCPSGGMGDANEPGARRNGRAVPRQEAQGERERLVTGRVGDGAKHAGTDGRNCWSNYIWLPCADGKARRIEPGIEPLAHGVPGRVGRLRAYGNAIVPELAAAFIEASLR
jgi:DNA (cytosine-5)-methyltransferase 1